MECPLLLLARFNSRLFSLKPKIFENKKGREEVESHLKGKKVTEPDYPKKFWL